MSQRYRITRTFQENAPGAAISLDECKRYFADKPDFAYSPQYTVTGSSSTMTIDGDFFLWSVGESVIPFRHYDGDLYVAITHEAVVPKMVEIASELRADITEG
ncbi:hypothetical protein [Cohnella fermenti]|uniref:Excinuclease n=1 Tax=Cohnella fermenti TaxID=2565925 RepID=A0A4S4BNW4_9BACL|nr:hypothetical protein [Cohnella fermenti]THF76399.1 hypothetical protein E6C55_19205 [Cohnella fermenti]